MVQIPVSSFEICEYMDLSLIAVSIHSCTEQPPGLSPSPCLCYLFLYLLG